MQLIIIMLFIAGAFMVQLALGYFQIKHFAKAYIELRKIGKVAIGKRPGRIRAGTIVLFAVSDSGKILKAMKIQGVTVLAKVRELKGLYGQKYKNAWRSRYGSLQQAIEISYFGCGQQL
ncbi:transcriptional regulator GutM [Aeribacillus sp. SP014]